MTFLEHGDIRKSGRAILIACTIFVLLNECSEAFEKIVLFGFEVRITHETMLGFLRVGIVTLCAVFAVRLVQGYADWKDAFSGKNAATARNDSLLEDRALGGFRLLSDRLTIAIKRIVDGNERESSTVVDDKVKRVKSEFYRYYFRRTGDQIDTLLIQVLLPIAAVIMLWGCPR